ncbi:DUF1294 domain-containing protein [Piscibacillus sp. B03]|uniref:DUF1294 domain-containing protein n=1 Tax=Piscibacillus sp. B03 TaxID=3457430 RepID=UPI003FCDC2D0
MDYIWFYLIIILSLIGFVCMGLDKRKARLHQWRIPEKTLWLLAIFGGAPGMWVGMSVFRHKTHHSTFKFGLPILSVLVLGVALYLS